MIAITEYHLTFEFDDRWDHVERWDKTDAFLTGIHGVEGVRALDIIAFSSSQNECLLLEVKDFRDQNDAEQKASKRLSRKRGKLPLVASGSDQVAASLVGQTAQKVAGTVAGLVGATRMQDTSFAGEFARGLARHRADGPKVRIVLWVEGHPTSKGRSIRAEPNLLTLTQKLKKKVAWLSRAPVQVLSSATDPLPIPGLTFVDAR